MNQLWYKQNGNWINPTILTKNNDYAKSIIYYKFKNNWVLLNNKSLNSISIIKNEILKCTNKQEFNDLIESKFANIGIEQSNILNAEFYELSSSGTCIRYGSIGDDQEPRDPYNSTFNPMCLFITKPMSLPKSISFTFVKLSGNTSIYRFFFALYFIEEDFSKAYSPIYGHSGSETDSSNIGVFVNNVKVAAGGITASWTISRTINLEDSSINYTFDKNKQYRLALYMPNRKITAASNPIPTPIYLSNLNLVWA